MNASPPPVEGKTRSSRGKTVGLEAQMLLGGLGTLRSTLSMIQERATNLMAIGLISEVELQSLDVLAREVAKLIEEYERGEFLNRLGPIVTQLRSRQTRR